MFRHWGVSQPVYDRRIKAGMSMETALTKKTNSHKTPCKDHTGKEFPSARAMCAAWGVTRDTYVRRVSEGWPLETALTTPADGSRHADVRPEKTRDNGPVKDHRGKEYKTLKSMCAAYGITVSRYRGRRSLGWDLERILTERDTANDKPFTGPDGSTSPSFKAWLDFYGLRRDRHTREMSSMDDLHTAMAADWPGRTFGPYEIIRMVSFPWFEVRENGAPLIMSDYDLHLEYLKSEWRKTPSVKKYSYPTNNPYFVKSKDE